LKASAIAPANIAFVKYWGARDLERALPVNPSISMTLSRCVSHSTVEHLPGEAGDEVLLASDDGSLAPAPEAFADRVRRHLARVREAARAGGAFRVATRNSFPAAAGLASSASGFAALTLAATAAAGLELSREKLSDLARLSGSGSAARSLLGGYVEWPRGRDEDEAHAFALAPASHWDLRDVIALVDRDPKAVPSLEGHRRAPSSPYFERRQALLPARLGAVRLAIALRDLAALGSVLEEEAIDLHLIAMSSRPAIFYWTPATLAVLAAVRRLRLEGISAWATLDAGPNVHVICDPGGEEAVAAALAAVPGVGRVLRDRVGGGPCLAAPDLF
jgi:diphosphomevalonate decarboxylase